MDKIILNNETFVPAPIGCIVSYNGFIADIPPSWALCDGTNGTIDMASKFIMGTVTEVEIGDTGGSNDSVAVSHTHTFVGDALAPHSHNMNGYWHSSGSSGGGRLHTGTGVSTSAATAGTPTGTISTDGVSGVGLNVPKYVKLAYIQRIS